MAAGDEHRLEITGGTRASMQIIENPELTVNIAPAEGHKPLFIMSCVTNAEQFCFEDSSKVTSVVCFTGTL